MDRQKTITAYNRHAMAYEEKFREFPPYVRQIEHLEKLLSEQDKILDLGCGPGNVARLLQKEKKLQYLGLDLSDEMIRLARKNNAEGAFEVGDITQCNFPLQQFDCIVVSFSMVHLQTEDAKELLVRAVRWLKKDGYLYLSFMEGKKPGYEQTSFSVDPIFFNYYEGTAVRQFLLDEKLKMVHQAESAYHELDGSVTKEIFFIGQK